MPQLTWDVRRERHGEYIREGLKERSRSDQAAKDLGIEGPSSMDKQQLLRAVIRRSGRKGR